MATTTTPLPRIGAQVHAEYTLRWKQGRRTLAIDRAVGGKLTHIERLSPTVFKFHVHDTVNRLDYVLDSRLATVEEV